MSGNPIGVTFEIGISAGVPIISLIEVYGQHTRTVTTFGRRYGRALAAPPGALDAAVAEAVARGASPEQATTFLSGLFG